jgi:hypothetical protein
MSALLLNTFKAFGPGASRREVAQVAAALRESGDEDMGRLLNYEENQRDWDRCCAIADDAGAYAFVALDLAVAFHNPEWFAGLSGAKTSTRQRRWLRRRRSSCPTAGRPFRLPRPIRPRGTAPSGWCPATGNRRRVAGGDSA